MIMYMRTCDVFLIFRYHLACKVLGIRADRCVILIVINNLVCFFLQNARSTLNFTLYFHNFHKHIYFIRS